MWLDREVLPMASHPPPIPDLRRSAFLLDVDGTLIDFAPTPREVSVPAALRQSLRRLLERTGGAVALVSGRPLKELDLLFAPLELPIIGGHGAEIRPTPTGASHDVPVSPLSERLRRRLATIKGDDPRIILEPKEHSLAIHYRLVPDKEDLIRDAVRIACEELAPDSVEILPGKFVFEIKSTGFDKGTGVRELMRYPPFAGRRPIFIGDDTTDEAAIAVMPELGGIGISVGREVAGAAGCFDTPHEVRTWLERASLAEDVPALDC
jgi:trehalose 6-phosphate phosphatase